jgi:hypothetical protein
MSMSVSGSSSTNPLAYLQQLLQQGTAGASSTGAADPLSELMQTLSGSGSDSDPLTSPDAAAGSGASGCQPFGADTMAQLLSLQQSQGQNGPEQAFFSKLDTDGDGKISKTEFEDAASKAGADSSVADAVFDKIDGNSDGSVSSDELAKADRPGGGHHHVHGGGGGGGGGLDALMSGAGADGATTKTMTNADGSTTTSITYADGTSIDLNSPAAASTTASTSSDSSASDGASASSSKASANLIAQLIKMQSQMLNAMSASASTMSIAA